MFLVDYLLFLGIAYIVFWFIQVVLALIGALLFTLIRFDRGPYLLKAFNLYVFVSLTALLALASMQENQTSIAVLVVAFTGGFVLFTLAGHASYEAEREAIMSRDYAAIAALKYDGLFVVGSVILYVVMLFVPSLALNGLTVRLLALIEWAYNVRILGWILRVGGTLFMLATAFQGLQMSLILAAGIIGKLGSKSESSGGAHRGERGIGENWFRRHLNWTWVFAYLLWVPLNASDELFLPLIGAVLILMVSGWVLRQKGRRLWWLLLTPVFAPLWLGNKKASSPHGLSSVAHPDRPGGFYAYGDPRTRAEVGERLPPKGGH